MAYCSQWSRRKQQVSERRVSQIWTPCCCHTRPPQTRRTLEYGNDIPTFVLDTKVVESSAKVRSTKGTKAVPGTSLLASLFMTLS